MIDAVQVRHKSFSASDDTGVDRTRVDAGGVANVAEMGIVHAVDGRFATERRLWGSTEIVLRDIPVAAMPVLGYKVKHDIDFECLVCKH